MNLAERIAALPRRDVRGYACPMCRDAGQVETATGFRACRGESETGCVELARRAEAARKAKRVEPAASGERGSL